MCDDCVEWMTPEETAVVVEALRESAKVWDIDSRPRDAATLRQKAEAIEQGYRLFQTAVDGVGPHYA